MNPKLNVWRLVRETSLVNGVPAISVLTLRDPHGKIMRTASTRSEEEELEKWWRAYQKKTNIEDIPVSKTLRKRYHAAIVRLNKRGFKYRMSFGGWRRKLERGGWEYCRWQAYKTTPWRRSDWLYYSAYFKSHSPKENLGLFTIPQTDGHSVPRPYPLTLRKKQRRRVNP